VHGYDLEKHNKLIKFADHKILEIRYGPCASEMVEFLEKAHILLYSAALKDASKDTGMHTTIVVGSGLRNLK
jgi:hypothetical protein